MNFNNIPLETLRAMLDAATKSLTESVSGNKVVSVARSNGDSVTFSQTSDSEILNNINSITSAIEGRTNRSGPVEFKS